MRTCRRRTSRYSDLDKLLLLFVLLQMAFWEATVRINPEMEVVPRVPSISMAKAASLGDDQLYFRTQLLGLQTAGMTFGRFVRLEEFDYLRVYYWMKLLDKFDFQSNSLPYMASFWFSRTQNTPDVRYMVDYLQEYVKGRMDQKWRWQMEALNLANYRLNDKDLAMRIAAPLQHVKNAPIIVRQLPAFIHEQRGEIPQARKVIEEIRADSTLSQGELNFIDYFLNERLKGAGSGVRYFGGRNAIITAVAAPAEPMSNPDERQIYAPNDIRRKALLGLRIGMAEDKAFKVLMQNKWSGAFRSYSHASRSDVFEKNGNKLWLYRVRGKDNKLHLWMIVYTEYLNNAPNLHVLTDVITRQYGAPSLMNINEQRSAYVYYYTSAKMRGAVLNVRAPQFEVEIGTSVMSFQLKDSSMLPEDE